MKVVYIGLGLQTSSFEKEAEPLPPYDCAESFETFSSKEWTEEV